MFKNKITFIICIFVISISSILYGAEKVIRPGQEKNEEEIIQESQKDLAAILQWSARYRFSPNLKVGDKVEYKLIDDPENKTDISLEVTKKEKNGVWILEKFAGNEIHMLVDLKNMELKNFYGYDEGKKILNPSILTKDNLEKRIEVLNEFKNGLAGFGIPQKWENKQEKANLKTKSGTIECSVIQPAFDKITKKKMQERKITRELYDKMKLYFNDEIPKLIPFEIAKYAIGSPDIYKDIDSGFYKNDVLIVKNYNKE